MSPGVEEVQAKLKVNYEGFGFRLEERMRRHLKSLSDEIESKERHSLDLAQEIASRKRLLSSLQNSPTGLDEAFLRTQLKARDRQIVLLSDRLFEITARRKWKPGEETKKITAAVAPIIAQIEALNGLVKQRDQAISQLLAIDNRELTRLREGKEGLLAQVASLRLELEENVNKAHALDLNLRETKTELERMKTSKGEIRLSAESDRNEDVKTLKISQMQLITALEEEEKHVLALKNDLETSKKQLIHWKATCTKAADSLASHRTTLSSFPDQSWPQLAQLQEQIQADYHALQEIIAASSVPNHPRDSSVETLQFELEAAKMEIERLSKGANEAQSRQEAAKMVNATLQGELEKSIAEKVSLIAGLDHEISALRQEVANFLPEKQELSIALTQALGNITALEGKIEDLNGANITLLGKLEVAEKLAKASSEHVQDLRQSLQKMERQSSQQDQAHSHLLLKLRTMEVELWNKDTEMLEREKKSVELAEEMEKLRVDGDQFNARLRKEVAEQLASINLQLEAKDQEILLLKGMLRSFQSQIKQKDTDLARIKRKAGEVSPKKPSDLSSPKVGQGEEAREMVETFCWQVERLRKFADSKKGRIAAMEAMGGVTPAWLKEELKLAKTPDASLTALEVLQKSIDQRLSLQLEKLSAVEGSGTWGFAGELAAQEAVLALPEMQGEQWEGLVESLRKYSSRVLLA